MLEERNTSHRSKEIATKEFGGDWSLMTIGASDIFLFSL